MQGTGKTVFSPNASATRGQLVTMLWRLAGAPASDYAAAFSDVAPDAWYADAVNWAAENQIVEGYADSTFRPDGKITREQLAALTGPQGVSITGTERVSGTGAPGTTDTYNVNLSNGNVGGTFDVYNGSNGQGSPGTSTPLTDSGSGVVGTATAYSRQDHRHGGTGWRQEGAPVR